MMKTRPYNKLLTRFTVVLIALLNLQAISHANASEANMNVYATQVSIASDGLAIQQPVISQTEILNTLTQAHRLLSEKGQAAKTVVEEHDAGKNMVVAAIMPGGLLYLAYQQSKVNTARETLSHVESELESLDTDAVTLYKPVYRPSNQPIIVARYP